MKRLSMLFVVMFVLVSLSCQSLNVTTLTVDGVVVYQESSTRLQGAYGVFVVAKADVEYYDRNAIPEISPPPPDTSSSFPKIDLPSFLTAESGAEVTVNGTRLNEEYAGQYQGTIDNIGPDDSVKISVVTQDGDTGKANMVMPGLFSLHISDTVIDYDSLNTIDISWTKSTNANAYMILLYSVDTTSNSMNLQIKETTEDTLFSISRTEISSGMYLLQVGAIYGKINASMPQAGSLIGVLGQVATIYMKKPVLIEIR